MSGAIMAMARGRVHYAWIVAALTFVVLLAAAGLRATPGVLIVPLEQAFGWSRATISFAIAVNIFLYGLMGPFAGAAVQRFGIRRGDPRGAGAPDVQRGRHDADRGTLAARAHLGPAGGNRQRHDWAGAGGGRGPIAGSPSGAG